MTDLGNPDRKITISNGLVVERYPDCIRVVQGNPGQLNPNSVVIPDTELGVLADTIEELQAASCTN